MSEASYAVVMGGAGKRLLYELDCLLKGEQGKPFPYRLTRTQYLEARSAILTLYGVLAQPDLEPHPAAEARSDRTFQAFLQAAATPPSGERGAGGTGAPPR